MGPWLNGTVPPVRGRGGRLFLSGHAKQAKLPDLPRPIEMRVSVNGTIVRLGREWRKRAPSRARGDDDAKVRD